MAQAEMTFWDHLDDLRVVLFKIAGVVAFFAVAAFMAMPWIFDHVIMAPTHGNFITYSWFNEIAVASGMGELATGNDFSINIVSIELASQLFIHLSASCWLAFTFAFPAVLYLLWGFVSPGLYENERQGIRKAFFFGNFMFYMGVAVGYFLIFPITVRFLAEYRLSDSISPIVSLDSYIDNFFTLLLMMGAVFELPLLAWLLGKIGLLKRNFFKNYRRHAIVVLMIIAALITPTGDPFTLFIVFTPIYALWEAGALLVPAAQEEPDLA